MTSYIYLMPRTGPSRTFLIRVSVATFVLPSRPCVSGTAASKSLSAHLYGCPLKRLKNGGRSKRTSASDVGFSTEHWRTPRQARSLAVGARAAAFTTSTTLTCMVTTTQRARCRGVDLVHMPCYVSVQVLLYSSRCVRSLRISMSYLAAPRTMTVPHGQASIPCVQLARALQVKGTSLCGISSVGSEEERLASRVGGQLRLCGPPTYSWPLN